MLGQSALVGRYGAIKGTRLCTGPAGTVYITGYPIWHRRHRATATDCVRHLLKWNYYRNSPPQRDWIIEEEFDPGFHSAAFSHLQAGGIYMRRNFLDSYDAAHMFTWLCGHKEEFRYIGGTSWPGPANRRQKRPDDLYGVPPFLRSPAHADAYQPDAAPMIRMS